MPDFQLVILEYDKMVLFKWIHMNNFWMKKCEKTVTDVRKSNLEKEKQGKGVFLFNNREFCISSFNFHQSKLGFCICFFNCQSCKCGQPPHNYIKRDLGNPNFSSTTIAIPRFSWTSSIVHMFKLML